MMVTNVVLVIHWVIRWKASYYILMLGQTLCLFFKDRESSNDLFRYRRSGRALDFY